jgi:hypothetical protein
METEVAGRGMGPRIVLMSPQPRGLRAVEDARQLRYRLDDVRVERRLESRTTVGSIVPPKKPVLAVIGSYALISPSMSNFLILRNASTTLFDRAGSAISVSRTRGTTCQLTPNLSLSQPHWPSLPPSDRRLQK